MNKFHAALLASIVVTLVFTTSGAMAQTKSKLPQILERGTLRVGTTGVVEGLADTRLAKALDAIHAEPSRAWTLQGLAVLAGMSRARFAAHFADVVGQPAIEYLAHWRLSVAQTLLAQGRQVKSIADEVGYGSPNALTRAFTQRIGQTPTQWLAQRVGGNLHLEDKFLASSELAELSNA